MLAIVGAFAMSVTANAADAAAGFPSELKLASGVVLHRSVAVRFESDRVIVKHLGGQDPIFYIHIDPSQRDAVMAAKAEAAKTLAAEKAAAAKEAAAVRTITGDVFVITRGAGSYKFGGATVKAYRKSDYEAARAKHETYLPVMSTMSADRADAAQYKAWSDVIAQFQALATAITNADGQFSIEVPKNEEVVVVSFTTRLAAGATERNMLFSEAGPGVVVAHLNASAF